MEGFSRCVPEGPPIGSGGEQEVDAQLQPELQEPRSRGRGSSVQGVGGISCASGRGARATAPARPHLAFDEGRDEGGELFHPAFLGRDRPHVERLGVDEARSR